ncbi:hypothetical protein E4U58_007615 [Claviceps cyperi]|nr:hypothetical protein E4U58_007615 [Claviceps cyperi]
MAVKEQDWNDRSRNEPENEQATTRENTNVLFEVGSWLCRCQRVIDAIDSANDSIVQVQPQDRSRSQELAETCRPVKRLALTHTLIATKPAYYSNQDNLFTLDSSLFIISNPPLRSKHHIKTPKHVSMVLPLYIVSLAALSLASGQRSCGFKIADCPSDQLCVPDSPECTDLNICLGTCQFRNSYTTCGGFRSQPVKCPSGAVCRDDPRVPGSCGLACDVPGICMPKKAPSCAGFAGRACPKGLQCYDVLHDGCDPQDGGADCIGVCL